MTPHQAAAAWQQRQLQLLASTYQQAWQQGANAYRTQQATPNVPTKAPTNLPMKPNAAVMSRALAPAATSLARMAATIATIVPTAPQLAVTATVAAATTLAIRQYLKTNGWLLGAGVSVAWAGEQAGYAQAADADGLLLDWQLDPNPAVHHCDDCPALAALPPMPLNWWPTLPGEAATDCNVGCRCSMRAVAASPPSLTAAQHEVISRIGNRQPVLVAA